MRHRFHMALHWILPLWVVCFALSWSTASAVVQSGRFQFAQATYTTTTDFGVALVVVQRHLGSDGRAAVYVSSLPIAGGNAVAGRDFKPIYNHSLLWQDGDDLDKELYIRVFNDELPQETTKNFMLYLHDANGASLNTERNQTRVLLAPPVNLLTGYFRFLQSSMVATESSSSTFEIPVLWEGGTTSKARLAYEIICESACDPDDYTVQSGPILEWTRGGNLTQSILINIPDDGVYEPTETFRVRLLPPGDLASPTVDPVADPSSAFSLPSATLGNVTEVQVTIQGPNDIHGGIVQFEAPCFPACVSNSYSVMDGGLVRAYVQRRNGSDGFVQVRVVSADGSAQSGVDYKPVDQILRWEEGDATTKFVLVDIITGVVRTKDTQFHLELVDIQALGDAPAASSIVASSTTIVLKGPSNIVASEVNFVRPSPLREVLRYPDVPFLPFVTQYDSGIRVCPRIVIQKPGTVTLYLQRFFGTMLHTPASVVVKTVDDTATSGVDYEPLDPAGLSVAWGETDDLTTTKAITLKVLDPPVYYTERRSFFVEIASVTDVALGLCYSVEVILDSVSQVPRVTSFSLDMDSGTLTVQTSDPVMAATMDPTAFVLQSDAVGTDERFQLSQQSTTASLDGMTITITLGKDDLNSLKRFQRLAKSSKTTFLSVAPGAFDYILESCTSPGLTACAHARFGGIPLTSALAVVSFTPDTTRPVLLSFTVDLPQRVMKLRFFEPVDHTTIRLESLGLSDTATAIDLRYLSSKSSQVFRPSPDPLSGVLLNDGNPLPHDATYITILVGHSDLASLKTVGNGQIGQQVASTFLTIGSDFISDFSSPPNSVIAIQTSPTEFLLQVAAADCSPCAANTFASSSCSDMKDRVCTACTVCPTNSYALVSCTAVQDTVCYPCTECFGSQYASTACSATTDRVCSSCTRCTLEEYEASPCANGQNRICRTCDSCTLTKDQQRLCNNSKRWKRRQMKAPYGCPTADQQYRTLEARLQRAKSNRCGAGRCSCTGNLPGNYNPNGASFPDDIRCTGPEVYGIDI